MPSVIDSLVVELGLDARSLTEQSRAALDQFKNTKDEAKKQGEEIEATGARMLDSFAGLKRVALGMTALFLGGMGIKEFVGHMTNLEASTGRVARTMDVSAAELSIWQGAAARMGNTAQGITGTLQGLSSEMNTFQITGQSSLLGPLQRLGVSMRDTNGHLKTSTQLFKDIVAATKGMDPAEMRAILTLLGFDQGAVNMAVEGQGKLQQALDETSKALRGGFSDKDVQMAKEYQAALADIDQSAQTLSRTLLTSLGPAISSVFKSISATIQGAPDRAQQNIDDLKKGNFGRALFGDMWDYITSPGANWSGLWGFVRSGSGAAGGAATGPSSGGGGGGGAAAGPSSGAADQNWSSFLSGLSYLETDHRDVGNATSSAQGFFQFLNGTAMVATRAGLPDPRAGGYEDQSAATRQFIEKFRPAAAEAVARGDYAAAERMLKDVWPSLPGGKQSQSPSRYQRFDAILGSPAAAAARHSSISNHSSSTKVDVGEVNINAPGARSADHLASEIGPALKRQLAIGAFNSGLA